MKVAIQGHPFRGKEVIQILKSLGGKNIHELCGNGKDYEHYYHINTCGIITFSSKYDLDNYKFYTLEEFEKEFPFKIGDKVTIVGLPDYPKVITKMTWMDNEIVYTFGDNTWYNTGALRKLEMKEKRNITLTLDKAKEWYNKGGELREIALQAFSERELNLLPKNWEEFCRRYESCCFSTRYTNIPLKYDALFKLEQLRDCWRQGWVPNWLEGNVTKYAIQKWRDKISIETTFVTHSFLSFPTYEMAKEFLECFKDLIEKAGDLI